MKKLALLLPAMRMGGAEKIALNFLDDLTKHYDVTLVLNKIEGELLSKVQTGVTICEDRLSAFNEIFKADLKRLHIINIIKDIFYYICVKLKCRKERNYRYLIKRTPWNLGKFDIAIAYVANVSTQIFSLADRVQADKKIAWIHGETTELQDIALYNDCYKGFDKIFTVSRVTYFHFIKKFPKCKDLVDVYYNPIKPEEILRLAEEPMQDVMSSEKVNIVSVGRITPEKGFDMLPEIVSILRKRNHRIHWWLIGDGTELNKIKEKAKTLNVEDYISFLGMKNNPYPYIKNCDIYVQPSYEEGYSTTICEAGILGKAIIGTTTSGGIREQIVEGESALLADPNPEALVEKIETLILNPAIKVLLEREAQKIDFSNRDEIDKLIKGV